MVITNVMEKTSCRSITETQGCFSLLEYDRDISVNKTTAQTEFFASQMHVRKRQVIANLTGNGVIIQAGAMQWIAGAVDVTTNINGVGDFAKKFLGGKVTGESAVKPRYSGTGTLVLEPTYKHILFEDVASWGAGGMVIEDKLFYACDDTVDMKVVARSNLSSAALGGEGLFNNCLTGKGIAVLESSVPRDELIVMELTEPDDVVKIDGNMAIAWSGSLKFTVEKTTKTLVGSAASGEGFVNVYRGVGKILFAPV
ncbi:MAG: AIM24 family protein [Oscillospiraceae bacterium]|nr:AIM24 family protein [Oscillospiraceae bacterium]